MARARSGTHWSAIASGALVLALSSGVRANLQAPATASEQSSAGGGLDTAQREAVLRFDPRTLPRAAQGVWKGWGPATPPPDAVLEAFTAGARAYQEGDFAAALAQLHDVLRRAPDHPGALYQSAAAYFRLRRYGDCAALAERFVAAAPSEVGATQVLGHAYYTLGEYDSARAHYSRVVAATPTNVEGWRGLGLSHLRLGDPAAGLAALDRALALRPEHADALVWRAQALVELERPAEALESALRGRDLSPYEPRTWFVLGSIFAALERREDSEAARARFVELNRIEQQVRAQESLLLNDPRAVEPRVTLVRLHVASGDKESVAENLRRLQRLLPDSLDVGVLALEAHAALNDAPAGESVAAEIERRYATAPAAWIAIERYWRSRGDEERAQRAADRRKALGAAGR
jgi:tetratricopeptide (TPR) repeat protein